MSFECCFSSEEIVQFFDSYFRQCAWESSYLEVESRNTHHFWMIIKNPEADVPYTLLHKHQRNHPYHRQCRCANFNSVIRKIKRHDSYILRKSR